MQELVKQTIEKFNLLKANDRVIVALSGGPDSVALLYVLARLKKDWRLHLHIAHLNHLLRKNEAEEDSKFVLSLAKKLDYPISCESINVKDFAKRKKLSIEEAARKLRYDFLVKTAKENGANKIALGHNWNDQAETVLMRFLRGSGISGLRGMPAKRELSGCLIIRPLIEIKREQIMNFLKAKKISYRIDSSNLENSFLRNKTRNSLIPLLEKEFNPNIKQRLVSFAENVSCDSDFLQSEGIRRFKAVRIGASQTEIALNAGKLSSLHEALQKLVCRMAIKQLKGDLRRIDYRHWKELDELVKQRPTNSVVDLPGGVSAIKKRERVVFYNRG
ncbi:MAG: tRNA lysidine(34) synthetase TilS [Candidatus Omnitrophica bacterium]|nr:tRNA lysidine(34) synthetase TilS [Candidatus Omnitrophota bacterium]